jgi:hypothetical protein
MKPGEKASHPKGMKAIAGISAEHRALLNEYRMARAARANPVGDGNYTVKSHRAAAILTALLWSPAAVTGTNGKRGAS